MEQTTEILPGSDTLADIAAKRAKVWEGSRYYADAERWMEGQWRDLIYPMIKDASFERVVDLACGHGRNSVYLKKLAGELCLTDILPDNIEACRKRLGEGGNLSYLVGNGHDLSGIADGWATLVYCFDAMVHFDPDIVRSYIIDTARVLVPGGHGFFHHSNLGCDERKYGTNPHARNLMSAEFFAFYARRAGLEVVAQQRITWGNDKDLDALTLVRRPT